ncbi:MAG: aminomethyl-transferring glycine dehydrogenase subunit GcvPB [Desulfuromusa sp.]
MMSTEGRGLVLEENLLFEQSQPGRIGYSIADLDVPAVAPDSGLTRNEIAGFPELSEVDVVRHYTRLSTWNYGVDSGFYPLGSCTMKYNPKVNEVAARLPGFTDIHPQTPEALNQGALELMYNLQRDLGEISGFPAMTLQPAAGAQGEFTGMLMIHAWHEANGQKRHKVIIPDTAHGTNPASSTLAGYEVITVASDGTLTKEAVAAVMDNDVAALMVTNPNTLGLFEADIREICDLVHERGGLVYSDGANLNAMMGISRPGDIGIDVMHFNLHKTFSTPHGGGGPGSGPVGVVEKLKPFLPVPVVIKAADGYKLDYDCPQSIGRLKSFYGHFGVLVRAYSYILSMGGEGLKRSTELAVLNANYIRARLEGEYVLPHQQRSLHEVVFSEDGLQNDCHTLDVAKRLIDYGYHPPTIYFPMVVHGALMIEPTETESKQTIDEFCDALLAIAEEAKTAPELLKQAPVRAKVKRLDEATAARKPKLRWELE